MDSIGEKHLCIGRGIIGYVDEMEKSRRGSDTKDKSSNIRHHHTVKTNNIPFVSNIGSEK